MYYQLTQTDLTFFHQNRYLLFKDFFSENELMTLNESQKEFDATRDHSNIKKLLQQRLFGQITQQLTKKKQIRFLFDMLIDSTHNHFTIESYTPFTETTMGILIPLKSESNQQDSITRFEEEPRDLLFIHPSLPLFSKEDPLSKEDPHTHLYRLFVLGGISSRYQIKLSSPYTMIPKKLGLSSGDMLNNADFPMLIT